MEKHKEEDSKEGQKWKMTKIGESLAVELPLTSNCQAG
jgi:hypothetical protein